MKTRISLRNINASRTIVRALAAGGLALSAAAFIGACAGESAPADAPEEATEHVAEHAAALSTPAPRRLGPGLFNANTYGAAKVKQVADLWLSNIAQGQPATQSSLAWGGDPGRAVDGNVDGAFWDGSVTHTDLDPNPSWQVDLGGTHSVTAITVWNRTDCCTTRLDGAVAQILDDAQNVVGSQPLAASNSPAVQGLIFSPPVAGHFVRIVGEQGQPLSLAEVEVWEQAPAQQHGDGVCWKKTYGRGVGTVPTECPGQEKNGALCYDTCAPGYYGVGPVCWAYCAPGYTDDGATCRRDAQIISADNSSCPWYDVCGLTLAKGCSSCPAGYANDGCTCRIDASIYAKSSYGRGAGSPLSCAPGLQYDAGLCYTPCSGGSAGVGPVCWGSCPADYPVQCGAACATSDAACAAGVFAMVSAPLNATANIATIVGSFGTATAFDTGVQVIGNSAKISAKAAIVSQLKQLAPSLSDLQNDSLSDTLANASVSGSFDWSTLDPTGVAAVVKAFNQPICN